MVSRLTNNIYHYFQGFSELSLKGKVSKAAFPVLLGLGLAGLGYVCYRSFYRPGTHSSSPQSKKPDLDIEFAKELRGLSVHVLIFIYDPDKHWGNWKIFVDELFRTYTNLANKFPNKEQAIIEKLFNSFIDTCTPLRERSMNFRKAMEKALKSTSREKPLEADFYQQLLTLIDEKLKNQD